VADPGEAGGSAPCACAYVGGREKRVEEEGRRGKRRERKKEEGRGRKEREKGDDGIRRFR
jgi:hypothetical protein